VDYTAWSSWDWYERSSVFVAVSGEGNDVQVLHAMKEHFKEPKNRFPLTLRTWTFTRKEFEIPLPHAILPYHKVRKTVMLWGRMVFFNNVFWETFLTDLLVNVHTEFLNPVKQNTWHPFLRPTSWCRIFRSVGPEIEQEEQDWSQLWHEIENFSDSIGHNSASVFRETPPFSSLNNWKKKTLYLVLNGLWRCQKY